MYHILMVLLASERGSLGPYQRTRQVQKVDFGLSSLLRGDCCSKGAGRQTPRSLNLPWSCVTIPSLRVMLQKSSVGLSSAHVEPRILDQCCVGKAQLTEPCDVALERREIEII
jgi:hypothetical protein